MANSHRILSSNLAWLPPRPPQASEITNDSPGSQPRHPTLQHVESPPKPASCGASGRDKGRFSGTGCSTSDLPRSNEAASTSRKLRQATVLTRSSFTWAWFNCSLSTGGVALLLSETPHRFHGLTAIGKLFYILDLVIFLLTVLGICTRFALMRDAPGGSRRALKKSLSHPTEGLFFPTSLLCGRVVQCPIFVTLADKV